MCRIFGGTNKNFRGAKCNKVDSLPPVAFINFFREGKETAHLGEALPPNTATAPPSCYGPEPMKLIFSIYQKSSRRMQIALFFKSILYYGIKVLRHQFSINSYNAVMMMGHMIELVRIFQIFYFILVNIQSLKYNINMWHQ